MDVDCVYSGNVEAVVPCASRRGAVIECTKSEVFLFRSLTDWSTAHPRSSAGTRSKANSPRKALCHARANLRQVKGTSRSWIVLRCVHTVETLRLGACGLELSLSYRHAKHVAGSLA